MLLFNTVSAEGNNLLSQIFVMALGIFAAAYFLKNDIKIGNFLNVLWIAVVLIVLNATLGWLLDFLATPFRILTLGLASFLVDAIVIKIAERFLKGFTVRGFLPAVFMAIIIALVTMIANWLF